MRALKSRTAGLNALIALFGPNSGGGGADDSFQNIATVSAPTTINTENTLVSVTTNATATVTIGTKVYAITVKDRTGSNTPTLPVNAASGALLEDPTDLGSFAASVNIETPNQAVSWRYNGTVYEIVSST